MVKAAPLHDLVMIKPLHRTSHSAGGLELIENNDRPREGIVVAVGPGKYTPKGTFVKPPVNVGDHVVFERSNLKPYKEDGIEYAMVPSSEILVRLIAGRKPTVFDTSAFDATEDRDAALRTMIVKYFTSHGLVQVADMPEQIWQFMDPVSGTTFPVGARSFLMERESLDEPPPYNVVSNTKAFSILKVEGHETMKDSVVVRIALLASPDVVPVEAA